MLTATRTSTLGLLLSWTAATLLCLRGSGGFRGQPLLMAESSGCPRNSSLTGKIIRFVKTSADEGVLVICQPGGKIITMFAPDLEFFLTKAH